MEINESSDAELLGRFASGGDREAFAGIVARHGRMVFRVCRRVTGDAHDAEDSAQLVFAALANRAPSLQRRHSLAGWLHWTAWHLAMKNRRDKQTRRRCEIVAATAVRRAIDITAGGIDSGVLKVEVDRALSLLPDEYREVLILHHLEGLTVEESARRLGCRVGTAASRLSRGRRVLRSKLAARGVVASVAAFVALLHRAVPEWSAAGTTAGESWDTESLEAMAASDLPAPTYDDIVGESDGCQGMGPMPDWVSATQAASVGPGPGALAAFSLKSKLKVAVLMLAFGGASTSAGRCFAQALFGYAESKLSEGWEYATTAAKPAEAAATAAPAPFTGSNFFAPQSSVPEPSSLASAAIAGYALFRRPRRAPPSR